MAITIVSLGNGQITSSATDTVILTADSDGSPAKVVRNLRFVNTGSEVGLDLYLKGLPRYDGTPPTSPVTRRLLPPGTKIPAGGLMVIEQEITLEAKKGSVAGDQILARLSATGTVDFLVSGFTRDS